MGRRRGALSLGGSARNPEGCIDAFDCLRYRRGAALQCVDARQAWMGVFAGDGDRLFEGADRQRAVDRESDRAYSSMPSCTKVENPRRVIVTV